MAVYIPPDPEWANKVHQSEQESREHFRRLEMAAAEELRRIVTDPAEAALARGNALGILLLRKDAVLPEILPTLFEDPVLGEMAIKYVTLTEPEIASEIYRLLDDPKDRIWSTAAMALARMKHEAIRPRLYDWFHESDEGHRNVAIQAWIELDPDEARRLFWESLEEEGQGEDDRLVLADALLRLGATQVVGFLESVARSAQGSWAVFAAMSVVQHNPTSGFRLLQWILDHGDSEALQALVMQAWNISRHRMRHAFTADGIHEARLWVEEELEKLEENPGLTFWNAPPL